MRALLNLINENENFFFFIATNNVNDLRDFIKNNEPAKKEIGEVELERILSRAVIVHKTTEKSTSTNKQGLIKAILDVADVKEGQKINLYFTDDNATIVEDMQKIEDSRIQNKSILQQQQGDVKFELPQKIEKKAEEKKVIQVSKPETSISTPIPPENTIYQNLENKIIEEMGIKRETQQPFLKKVLIDNKIKIQYTSTSNNQVTIGSDLFYNTYIKSIYEEKTTYEDRKNLFSKAAAEGEFFVKETSIHNNLVNTTYIQELTASYCEFFIQKNRSFTLDNNINFLKNLINDLENKDKKNYVIQKLTQGSSRLYTICEIGGEEAIKNVLKVFKINLSKKRIV